MRRSYGRLKKVLLGSTRLWKQETKNWVYLQTDYICVRMSHELYEKEFSMIEANEDPKIAARCRQMYDRDVARLERYAPEARPRRNTVRRERVRLLLHDSREPLEINEKFFEALAAATLEYDGLLAYGTQKNRPIYFNPLGDVQAIGMPINYKSPEIVLRFPVC